MSDLRAELKALLEKHNCSIVWECCDSSDMHGIHGERMEVVDNKTEKVLLSTKGSDLSHHDL